MDAKQIPWNVAVNLNDVGLSMIALSEGRADLARNTFEQARVLLDQSPVPRGFAGEVLLLDWLEFQAPARESRNPALRRRLPAGPIPAVIKRRVSAGQTIPARSVGVGAFGFAKRWSVSGDHSHQFALNGSSPASALRALTLLVDYRGRLFRGGKVAISRELAAIFERLARRLKVVGHGWRISGEVGSSAACRGNLRRRTGVCQPPGRAQVGQSGPIPER